jgi:hypothetical protein
MKTLCLLFASLLLSPWALAACGDNQRNLPDAGSTFVPGPSSRAVVVVGDFTPGDFGVLSTLDTATRTVHMNVGPTGAVGSDPVLRHIGRELVIVNRGENNVSILDDDTLAFKEQLGIGAGSFAQDVAVAGNKLYVAATGTKGVVVLTRDSTATTTIDLSADDPDGFPDCDSVYLVDTQLYVACGLLKNFQATGPGKVYVVDTTNDTVRPELTVTLVHNNPLGWFERFPAGSPHAGELAIPTVEDFVTAPGCIERVAVGAAPASAGCLVDNPALGGFAVRTDIEADGNGEIVWTAVADPADFSRGRLRLFDMTTGALRPAQVNPDSQKVTDVVHCPSGHTVVFDSTIGSPGLRVYKGTAETTAGALPIGNAKEGLPQHGLVCY